MKNKDWEIVKENLSILQEITWEYSTLMASKTVKSWDAVKPERKKDESINSFNDRMIKWSEEKDESYQTIFEEFKGKSFKRVKKLEFYFQQLGMPID